MCSNNQYNILAEDYEELNPKAEIYKQQSFFKEIIIKNKIKTCLDCSCGAGWHLKMITEMGVTCFGSDLSVDMLELAKKNLKSNSIPLKIGNFLTLDKLWSNKFDLVICMTTSFPHLKNISEMKRATKSISNCLSPGGILLIDNGFSDSFFDHKPKFIPAREDSNSGFYFFLEYLASKYVRFNILRVSYSMKKISNKFTSFLYYQMRKSTFERVFKKSDFRKVTFFGDFEFSKYSEKLSKRLICLAKKVTRPDV
ncbi:MAG: class I SAM-dependent methyltransferase [Candidatus Riflebacteria bacterium]|nr:class I SAM-dependent methyltransferase [Candidatus Riflebacteria bacterium]